MSSPSDDDDLLVIAPGTRATAVIVHEVPEAKGEAFLAWQKSVTRVVRGFPGYERTEIFPPEPGALGRWVTLVHFRSHAELDVWLKSPERAERLQEFHDRFGFFTLRHMGRFDAWFTEGIDPVRVPGWKMALTVLAALYPTVMLLQAVLGPFLQPFNLSARMLIGNFVSVSMLQWLMMPLATALLAAWLRPAASLRQSLAGAAAVAAFLAAMLGLFSFLIG